MIAVGHLALFLPGEGTTVKYKYCIFSGGKFTRWEGGPTFERILDIHSHEQTTKTTADDFGKHESVLPTQLSTSIARSPKSDDSSKSRCLSEWNKRVKLNSTISSNDGVVIVSYFLPVIMSKSAEGEWSATWDEENILSFNLPVRATWIGSVRYNGAAIPVEDEEKVTEVLAQLNCNPIFINQTVHHQFYEIFCKQNLWLLMHLISDVYGPVDTVEIGAKSQQDLWYTYITVNNIFRDKLIEVYHTGDLVWIHGFHLMLLPSFIRRRLQQAKIGYFFHTPFPSSEIWKTITRRDDLLRGILASDQIGFHLFEYARHFLTSCHRLLGYSSDANASGIMTVNVDGREVAISCIHIGVDLARVKRELMAPSFPQNVNAWIARCSDKILVSGIDKLERLKGLPLKLHAIDEFMTENPQYIGKIAFVMIGVSASERGSDYRRTVHDVKIIVDKLNHKYRSGSNPNDFLIYFEERQEKDVNLRERLALFAASDCLMITPPRDGLNRLPMEFTIAKRRAMELHETQDCPPNMKLKGHASKGLVIMSEFISSARVMRGAIIVNPWRMEEVKAALKHVIEIKASELADRVRRNLEFSTRLTTESWATQVLQDLKSIEKSDDPNDIETFGFGTGFRIMGVRAGFQTLNVTEVSKAYRNARHRLILLDWGGTLVNESLKNDSLYAYAVSQGQTVKYEQNAVLKNALEILCADVKNIVFVVSGCDIASVSDFFGEVKGLGLAAEHGCYYRWPRDDGLNLSLTPHHHDHVPFHTTKAKWQTMVTVADQSWKDAAKKIMDIYVKRTSGTYIEQKGNALIWQFRDADPEFGYMQSKDLEDHLKDMLSGYAVEILRGGGVSDGYIEVRLAGLSKGHFLNHALDIMKSIDKYADFILAVGDDSSDEPMFEQIARMQGLPDLSTFSVTVGKKPTSALAYVNDPSAVLELINTLNKMNARDKRYFSTHDLPSQAFESTTSSVKTNVNVNITPFNHTVAYTSVGSSKAVAL
jgi:trehalose 6-phosphate synthase/phosphatase